MTVDDPSDPPEVESVRLWGALELEASRLGAAAARFDAARSDFVTHQRRHGFVRPDGRVRSIRDNPKEST